MNNEERARLDMIIKNYNKQAQCMRHSMNKMDYWREEGKKLGVDIANDRSYN